MRNGGIIGCIKRAAGVLCAVGGTVVGAGQAAAGTDSYLAIGDSLAFGYSTLFGTPQGDGDNGYVRRFADALGADRGARPEVINLAVPGETVADFFTQPGFGYLFNTNYFDSPLDGPRASQAALVGEVLAEHVSGVRTISNVTVQLGVNDLLMLAETPGFLSLPLADQLAAADATIADVSAGLSSLLEAVGASAPGADVRVMGYYNPFAIVPGDPLSPVAALAVDPLNEALRSVAAANGAAFVDVFDLFAGRESELTRILTQDDLGGANIHPTELGYEVLASALIAVPAPGAGFALLAGALVVGVRRRGR